MAKTATVNKPVDHVRLGRVSASIWKNDSESGSFYSASLSVSYKDAEGNWQDGGSFGVDDLPRVAEVARQAYVRIHELRKEERD